MSCLLAEGDGAEVQAYLHLLGDQRDGGNGYTPAAFSSQLMAGYTRMTSISRWGGRGALFLPCQPPVPQW
jgi:hypothetical protein